MRPGFALLLATAILALPALSAAGAPATVPAPDALARSTSSRSVAIFYYPWFGTPRRDGAWEHWNQAGATPPFALASNYFPARGPYSSDDPRVVDSQLNEIAAAGVDTVIVSWWGRPSIEDDRLPAVLEAARAYGLAVAIHLEPYPERSFETVAADIAYLRSLGITDFYVYDSGWLPDDGWAALNDSLVGVRLFANTALAGKAKAGHFDGLYTYDVLVYDGHSFRRMCASARRLGLVCAPSVGPGYDARRATGDERVRPRLNGATYDTFWRRALRAHADEVTITSFNEWHEGTQIEPARWAGPLYESYEGAWGETGIAARNAYLDRTAVWSERFRATG